MSMFVFPVQKFVPLSKASRPPIRPPAIPPSKVPKPPEPRPARRPFPKLCPSNQELPALLIKPPANPALAPEAAPARNPVEEIPFANPAAPVQKLPPAIATFTPDANPAPTAPATAPVTRCPSPFALNWNSCDAQLKTPPIAAPMIRFQKSPLGSVYFSGLFKQ